jgi:hypothetical protein
MRHVEGELIFFQLCVGRLPSRRPIKSPRLEPPRYVNALPCRDGRDASDTEESDFNSQESGTVNFTPRNLKI